MQIIKKTWGEERWLVNDEFCCKEIYIKENWKCSLHYHKIKDELFYIISGKIIMECNYKSQTMLPGNWIRIKPNEIHRFTGLMDSLILESSTHHDENDSYRLEYSKYLQ